MTFYYFTTIFSLWAKLTNRPKKPPKICKKHEKSKSARKGLLFSVINDIITMFIKHGGIPNEKSF